MQVFCFILHFNKLKFEKRNFMGDISSLRKQAKKYIDQADDKTLEIVYRILETSDESNDPLAGMSVEQEAAFKRGMKDAKAGRVTPHNEVMKKYKKWLTK